VKTGDDAYTVMANVTWQYMTVEENAKSEATRKEALRHSRFAGQRYKLLRAQSDAGVAQQDRAALGYKSWDDYQTETRMAKTGANAEKYINDLTTGIQPSSPPKLPRCKDEKPAEIKDPNARIGTWDWRYYQNQINKQKFTVDKEALRVFFPVPKSARWHVRHLPKHFWAEV